MAVRGKETTSDRSPTISPGSESVGGYSFSLIGCYRIQVAFSVSILGVTIQYDGHSLHDFSADLEFIVVVMPYTSLRRSTSWSVVGNGSEDSFRFARDPPRCTGAQSQASAGLL